MEDQTPLICIFLPASDLQIQHNTQIQPDPSTAHKAFS